MATERNSGGEDCSVEVAWEEPTPFSNELPTDRLKTKIDVAPPERFSPTSIFGFPQPSFPAIAERNNNINNDFSTLQYLQHPLSNNNPFPKTSSLPTRSILSKQKADSFFATAGSITNNIFDLNETSSFSYGSDNSISGSTINDNLHHHNNNGLNDSSTVYSMAVLHPSPARLLRRTQSEQIPSIANREKKHVAFNDMTQVRYFSRSQEEVKIMKQCALERKLKLQRRRAIRRQKMAADLLNWSLMKDDDDIDTDCSISSSSSSSIGGRRECRPYYYPCIADTSSSSDPTCGMSSGGDSNSTGTSTSPREVLQDVVNDLTDLFQGVMVSSTTKSNTNNETKPTSQTTTTKVTDDSTTATATTTEDDDPWILTALHCGKNM